ncbi:MAG TPA: antitoxin [Terriglobia bacterium]|nr:antitoxin [Terriglobia bacterium]
MSKRLQVILDDKELRDIKQMAQAKRLTVAEWVRQTLRAARRGEATGDAARKLAIIEAAARHSAPTGDINKMLKEISAGYALKRR